MTNPAIATFVTEASDLLEEMEDQLLRLESHPSKSLVDAIFRALHTVKGSGSMFGFDVLARFTHHFENAFDQVREDKLQINSDLINLSFRARDYMVQLLDAGGDTPTALEMEKSKVPHAIISELGLLVGQSDEALVSDARDVGTSPENGLKTFEISFKPAPNDMHNGMRPDLLLQEIEELGQLSVRKDYSDVPAFDQMDPTQCYIIWKMSLQTTKGLEAIEDVFIFADDAELTIKEIRGASGKPVMTSELADQDADASLPPAQQQISKKPENIRVSSDRLDGMMDRLGELVIAQARLNQIALQFNDPGLEGVVEEVERLVTGLRDTTLSIRMLPIEGVFNKFRRVVRDLSQELGKEVTLSTSGGETEIDKNVIDRLSEPLVHMIRNSMDHGIEDSETRLAIGKSTAGRVKLSAQQESGEILITIEDDGAGLNTDAIRARAKDRGLISEESSPSDAELHQLIFAPGFSTAAKVTSVSGRGVGMDAVKTTVDALKGSLEVESQPGIGSKVSLRLPVSLAIIDGLLIRLGNARYVIPLSSVEECVELDQVESQRTSGRTMLGIREMLVPFLDLATIFNNVKSEETRRRVVIVRAEGAQLGIVVDDILGQTQTVVKSLSVFHSAIEGFAGATILGDGTTALIVDVAVLVRSAHTRHRDIDTQSTNDHLRRISA